MDIPPGYCELASGEGDSFNFSWLMPDMPQCHNCGFCLLIATQARRPPQTTVCFPCSRCHVLTRLVRGLTSATSPRVPVKQVTSPTASCCCATLRNALYFGAHWDSNPDLASDCFAGVHSHVLSISLCTPKRNGRARTGA